MTTFPARRVRHGKSHSRTYINRFSPERSQPLPCVGNVRVRLRVHWPTVLVYVIAALSARIFVTGTLATPIRDETVSFVVFVFCCYLIAQRIGRNIARAEWSKTSKACRRP